MRIFHDMRTELQMYETCEMNKEFQFDEMAISLKMRPKQIKFSEHAA